MKLQGLSIRFAVTPDVWWKRVRIGGAHESQVCLKSLTVSFSLGFLGRWCCIPRKSKKWNTWKWTFARGIFELGSHDCQVPGGKFWMMFYNFKTDQLTGSGYSSCTKNLELLFFQHFLVLIFVNPEFFRQRNYRLHTLDLHSDALSKRAENNKNILSCLFKVFF